MQHCTMTHSTVKPDGLVRHWIMPGWQPVYRETKSPSSGTNFSATKTETAGDEDNKEPASFLGDQEPQDKKCM